MKRMLEMLGALSLITFGVKVVLYDEYNSRTLARVHDVLNAKF